MKFLESSGKFIGAYMCNKPTNTHYFDSLSIPLFHRPYMFRRQHVIFMELYYVVWEVTQNSSCGFASIS
jgi:hypothetical protein